MTSLTSTPPASVAPEPAAAPDAGWDEPVGVPPRGTVLLLPGRGETPRTYGRLGRRLAADAYRVRVLDVDPGNPDGTRARLRAALADPAVVAPRVLLGSDTGALAAATLVDEGRSVGIGVGAVILAGPGAGVAPGDWTDELAARTSCPTHRRVLAEDPGFDRGALARRPEPSPWSDRVPRADVPTLVLQGDADPVVPAEEVVAAYEGRPHTQVVLIRDGHHDVLNDVSHRSVAATIVLFLENLRAGADRSPIVRTPVDR